MKQKKKTVPLDDACVEVLQGWKRIEWVRTILEKDMLG